MFDAARADQIIARAHRRMRGTDLHVHPLVNCAARHLIDHARVIKRRLKNPARMGLWSDALTPLWADLGHAPLQSLDPAALPAQALDCLILFGDLHHHNDLGAWLAAAQSLLAPDGVMLAQMIGGETAHELRQILTEVEIRHYGGLSPRVLPMIDAQGVAALLQETAWALPVVDRQIVRLGYRSIRDLARDTRDLAETSGWLAHRHSRPLNRVFWADVEAGLHQHFGSDTGDRFEITLELLTMIGWAPSPDQPRPARRGSATASLATILQSYSPQQPT